MAHRIRLGELLVKAGVLDELQLRSALNEQRKWGGQLGKILIDLGFVDESVMVKALSKQLGVPRAQLDTADLPRDILARIDAESARAHRYCPESYDPARKTITVAMADPTNITAMDDLAFRTGCRIEATLAGETEVSRGIDKVFFGREESSVDLASEQRFASMGGTDQGPFSDFDPQRLGDQPLRPPSAPRSWGGTERFGPVSPPPSSASETSASGADLVSPPAVWGGESSISTAEQETMASKLESAQKRQNRAIRVMLEMLIERGVFTEDEFRARLGVLRARSRRD